MEYAEVSVNSPVAQRRTFSYAIPSGLDIDVGQAVWIPFGDSDRGFWWLVKDVRKAGGYKQSHHNERAQCKPSSHHPFLLHQFSLLEWIVSRASWDQLPHPQPLPDELSDSSRFTTRSVMLAMLLFPRLSITVSWRV